MRVIKAAGGESGGRAVALRAQSSGRVFSGGSAPWLEEVEFKRLAVLMALGTAAISSWFVTAATVRIPELPPDAFFYVHQLPSIYWFGLISTFALLALRSLVKNRARTFLEISALLFLAMYLFALPFFFSSRRRHTRSLRDWSSDVCSSDLSCTSSTADGRPPSTSRPVS